MKKIFYVFMIIVFSCFGFPIPRTNAELKLDLIKDEPEISLDFKDVDLKDALKAFSIQSGINFISSENVQERKITLYLDKVPLKKAMDEFFKANNLTYDLDKDANIFIVKDWGKLGVETETKVFYLKYATVSSSSLKEEMSNQLSSSSDSTSSSGSSSSSSSSSGSSSSSSGGEGKWKSEENVGLTNIVKKLLTENGSVVEDYRTNSLVVTDIPSRIQVIAKTIASLDIPSTQVLLEVEMLDVSKEVADQIGFKFGQTPLTFVLSGTSIPTGFPFHAWSKSFLTDSTRGSLGINSTAATSYQAQIDFLRTNTDTKYLARPRLLTLNNETAEIKIVTQESIGLKSTTTAAEGQSTSTSEAERAETGVSLRVTPQINTDIGEITMFIYPKVSEAVKGNALTDGTRTIQYRDPEIRTTKSVVRVKDGDTVVIGGLLRTQRQEVITQLPFLGDLPFVGSLFRHKALTPNKDRELIVFITPRIVKNNEVKLAKTEKSVSIPASIPLREQEMSDMDRQEKITSSLSNLEKRK